MTSLKLIKSIWPISLDRHFRLTSHSARKAYCGQALLRGSRGCDTLSEARIDVGYCWVLHLRRQKISVGQTCMSSKHRMVTGWWFGTWMDYFSIFFPSYWECHHPIWIHLTHIFQRGRYTTNQAKTKHRTFSDFWILYFDPRLIGEIPSLSPLTVREYTIAYLVGGFKHFFIFHNIWDNPSYWLSHFSRWLTPLTRYNANTHV